MKISPPVTVIIANLSILQWKLSPRKRHGFYGERNHGLHVMKTDILGAGQSVEFITIINPWKEWNRMEKKNALLESGPPFYVVIRATQRSSRLPCKGSEPWPAPGIEPAISHSELKRSTDWANPARMISTADGNANQNEDKLCVLKNRAKIWGKIFSRKIVLNLVWHTDALFAEYSARRSHKLTTCLFCFRFLEFKTSPTLGNSQLAASCQLGFFIMLCSIWIIRFY